MIKYTGQADVKADRAMIHHKAIPHGAFSSSGDGCEPWQRSPKR
jgi:hypothetical protein